MLVNDQRAQIREGAVIVVTNVRTMILLWRNISNLRPIIHSVKTDGAWNECKIDNIVCV